MKARFLTPLILEDLPGKWWRLEQPLAYYSSMQDATIVAPRGFVTDTASVPRLPFAYWLYGGRGNAPAVIHDRIYRWADIPRITADKVFCEALKAIGKWGITRWPMTAAVMGFGWVAYKNYPGCLDYREAKRRSCPGKEAFCIGCDLYYNRWRKCVMPGYKPEIVDHHRSLE